jgi:NitT/TauT family transport system substrate-binding protein
LNSKSGNYISKKIFFLFLLFIISASLLFSQQLKKVTFVPHWVPQAQFAGYYVALEKGIYKKYGIDLEIITGGPNVSSAALLKEGKVDLALMWLSNAIELKAKGAKIINFAQCVNRSALMLVTKKSSGINSPKDMNGKKIGIWGGDFQIQPMAFFKKYDLNVKTIMQGNSINLFFFDGIDVTSAMWYNEYNTIINSGINKDELNTFFFSDYGLNFPEEGIYCSESFYNKNREICEAFLSASLEGWRYAFDHPEEAIEIIIRYMKEANLPCSRSHQRWMLDCMEQLYFPSKKMDNFEVLPVENYMLLAKILLENGHIDKIPPYNDLYKPLKRGQSK